MTGERLTREQITEEYEGLQLALQAAGWEDESATLRAIFSTQRAEIERLREALRVAESYIDTDAYKDYQAEKIT